MLLDKIKSITTCTICFCFALMLCSACSLKLIAIKYVVTPTDVVKFARTQPLLNWPLPLLLYFVASLIVSTLFALLIWTALKNYKWGWRPRSIDGSESADALMQLSAQKNPKIFGGKFGGKIFFASVEDRGLVIGPPGTGKTAFLFNQILKLTKTRTSFVAIDSKPELHKTLALALQNAGYRVLRVNPAKIDAQADHWNPLSDIDDETELAELCSALLPIRDAREAPFIESQRDWLKAAVFHVSCQIGGSLPSAFNFLASNSDPVSILDSLSKSRNEVASRLARRMIAGLTGAKPDPLILQGLTGAMRSLDYLALRGVQDALGHSDFSVKEVGMKGQPIALFLQFEESKINALGPLLAFMSTSVITTLISSAGTRLPVALFLDEIGNMPPIPNLPEKLNTIRSRLMPTWLYFQTIEQMNLRYGPGAESTFFSSSDFQMTFRLNDASSRELFSKLIGTTQKWKFTTNAAGVTRTKQTVNIIDPHEFGRLKSGEVVVLYRGEAAKGHATPYFKDYPQFKFKQN